MFDTFHIISFVDIAVVKMCLIVVLLVGVIVPDTAWSAADLCPENCHCVKDTVNCNSQTTVPQQFGDFSAIRIFNLSHNNLTSVTQNDFVKFINLQKLYLNGNDISTIENGSFSSLGQLSLLNMSSNNLKQIEHGVFCNLTNLNTLLLNRNYITNLSMDVFHNVPNLEHLSLSENRIHAMNSGTFPLPGLRTLNLDNNSLSMIPSNIFNCTPNLQSIKLNLNRISNISDYSFSSIPNVSHVSLNYNHITHIAIEAFEVRHSNPNTLLECKIEFFSIFGNLLMDVPQALNDLTYVVHLDISDNNIAQIKTQSLYRLKKLRYLRISEMPLLKHIAPDAFGGLNLRDVHMSKNPMLKKLPENLLQDMSELRVVVINNNGLQSVPKSLCNWQQLMDVMMDMNNFICGCGIRWLQTYHGWGTPQTKQHMLKLQCHKPSHPENVLIKDYDFDHLACTYPAVVQKSRVLVGLIAATLALLTVCMILFLVRYRKRLTFQYRQFKYKRHSDSAYTIDTDCKYSDLSTNGDLHGDVPTARDKDILLT